jgi:hypothetical protein
MTLVHLLEGHNSNYPVRTLDLLVQGDTRDEVGRLLIGFGEGEE